MQKTSSQMSINDLCTESSDNEISIEGSTSPSREEEVAMVLSEMPNHQNFISRVSQLPVVNNTIRTINSAYESSKHSSSVLRFSAETVESGVKTLLEPVLSRIINLERPQAQLTQLDSFACRQLDKLEQSYPSILHPVQQQQQQQPQQVQQSEVEGNQMQHHTPRQNVVSRWNSYLSEESLKSLKFCLEWLRYATTHIDQQIHVLKEAMQQAAHSNELLQQLVQLATAVKREVVETLRKVVDIIGKYAGSALPLEARNLVRGFILSLPNRWAAIAGSSQHSEPARVLNLAEESNHMLKSTMSVFNQSVNAAEYLFATPHVEPVTQDQQTMELADAQFLQHQKESEVHTMEE